MREALARIPSHVRFEAAERSARTVRIGGHLLSRPWDIVGGVVALGLAVAICVNALALQNGRVPARAVPTPSSRPAEMPRTDTTPAARLAAPATPAPAVPAQSAQPALAPKPIDRTQLIKDVQAELIRLKLADGAADGVLGPKTEQAIRTFEIFAEMKPTGEATPELLAALRSAQGGSAKPAAPPQPNARVMTIQKLLNERNFGPVKADGVFGEGTKAAIRRFESSRGLPPTGEITPKLLREIKAATGVSVD